MLQGIAQCELHACVHGMSAYASPPHRTKGLAKATCTPAPEAGLLLLHCDMYEAC